VGIEAAEVQHLDITNEEAEAQVLALGEVMVASDVGSLAITPANARRTCSQTRKMPRSLEVRWCEEQWKPVSKMHP